MEGLHYPLASLPSRERGLKSPFVAGVLATLGSLPSRERGLKFLFGLYQLGGDRGRSLRGSVD